MPPDNDNSGREGSGSEPDNSDSQDNMTDSHEDDHGSDISWEFSDCENVPPNESLSAEDLAKEREEIEKQAADRFTEILGYGRHEAIMFIRFMEWNIGRAETKLAEDGLAEILLKAGIILPPRICQVCDNEDPEQLYSLACGHLFCHDCWTQYLTLKIRDEGQAQFVCMAPNCNLIVPDAVVDEHVDANTLKRFHDNLARKFTMSRSRRKMGACPHVSCQNTIKRSAAANRDSPHTVQCAAGHLFCFKCRLEGDHRPLPCSIANLWLDKYNGDGTPNWINTNTKPCPGCQNNIEKHGGCNHMTCRSCSMEFCWVCLLAWSQHGAQYTCNRFERNLRVDNPNSQHDGKVSERDLFYYRRYANHEQSAAFIQSLDSHCEKIISEMQDAGLTYAEARCVKKAANEIIKCHNLLKWIYVMIYYMLGGNEREMLEDSQKDLERAIEDLSELLERPVGSQNVDTLRRQIVDGTNHVSKYSKVSIEYIENRLNQRQPWDPLLVPNPSNS